MFNFSVLGIFIGFIISLSLVAFFFWARKRKRKKRNKDLLVEYIRTSGVPKKEKENQEIKETTKK